MSKLDLLLNDIEINCDPAEFQGFVAKFMIDCVALIEHKLPLAAGAGFSACRHYLAGEGSTQTVKRAILDCWAAEETRKWDSPTDIPELSANRAVLCILKRLEGDDADLVDLLGFFLNLVNSVEVHEEEQAALLRKHFAACPADPE